MNELDSRIAQELDDEALFRLAEGEPHEFSSEYHEKMKRLCKKAGAHPKRKMTPMRRIVAVAAIIAVLTGTAAAATFWEDIRQFFVMAFGEYVELRVGLGVEPNIASLDGLPDEWSKFWYPEKCPDGYKLLSVEMHGERKVITFTSGETKLQLSQWPNQNSFNADNEAEIITGVTIHGTEVYAMEKTIGENVLRSVIWTNGDISLKLRGMLSFDELSNIAENLVYIE